jgi:hypothetical protein
LIAFGCRQIKNSIGGTLPHDTEINNDEKQSITDKLGAFTVSLGEKDCDIVLPFQLFSDERWVRFVFLLLHLENLNVSMTISEQQKIKADHLDSTKPFPTASHPSHKRQMQAYSLEYAIHVFQPCHECCMHGIEQPHS